jgi:hypothetical protein
VVEHRRLEHVDAGVDQVGDPGVLEVAGLLQEGGDAVVVVHRDQAEGARVGDPDQGQGGGRLALAVQLDQALEVDVDEHVAVEHQEGAVKQVGEALDRPGGPHRGVFGGQHDLDPGLAGLGQELVEGLGQVHGREHDLGEAAGGELAQGVEQERFVGERDQRLGPGAGQRAQSGAEASGENDGLHVGDLLRRWSRPASTGRRLAVYGAGAAPRRARRAISEWDTILPPGR